MYTIDFNNKNTARTYGVRINGELIKFTHRPYWKKDFLETSLNGYSNYLNHGEKVFLEDYLSAKFPIGTIRTAMLMNLTPVKNTLYLWPLWFAQFAGYKVTPGAIVEIFQYNFSFDRTVANLVDSSSIYKFAVK